MSLVWDIRWPTQNHLLVMLKLADHANDDGGRVFPSVATIAAQAQCSERTVQNVLKAFRDCGLASVVKQGSGSTPNLYELNVDLIRALSGRTLEGCADHIELPVGIVEQTGATVAPLEFAPVQPATERGATGDNRGAKLLHPNHQKQPSREPSTRERAKDLKSDLGSEGAQAAKTTLPCFTITPADSSWAEWIEHLRTLGDGLAFDANARKRIKASSRYPKPDSVVFEPKASQPLSEKSKRMSGEAA